jgi:phosphatidylglycerophosphate synthase
MHVPVLLEGCWEFRDLFPMKCSLQCPQCVPGLLLICSLCYFIFFAKCSISYSHSSHVSFTCVSYVNLMCSANYILFVAMGSPCCSPLFLTLYPKLFVQSQYSCHLYNQAKWEQPCYSALCVRWSTIVLAWYQALQKCNNAHKTYFELGT